MSKILLFRPTPRGNIQEVEEYNSLLPCDTLHIKYALSTPAYSAARKYFLDHAQYDYFVIAPDDLIVKPEHVTSIEKLCDDYDYPVISGMCNVSEMQLKPKGVVNFVMGKVPPTMHYKNGRKFNWATRDKLPKENIFKVSYTGMALGAIRRDIMEKYNFGLRQDIGRDLTLCNMCYENDIPIYVDQRLDMIHLRYCGTMNVGIKLPEVWFNDQRLPSWEFNLE